MFLSYSARLNRSGQTPLEIMEADRAIIFGPMRLPFLVLPPACVALGAATAAWSGSEINLFYLLIALIGALRLALNRV